VFTANLFNLDNFCAYPEIGGLRVGLYYLQKNIEMYGNSPSVPYGT